MAGKAEAEGAPAAAEARADTMKAQAAQEPGPFPGLCFLPDLLRRFVKSFPEVSSLSTRQRWNIPRIYCHCHGTLM
jgi:uncharacterized membrane protein YqiK